MTNVVLFVQALDMAFQNRSTVSPEAYQRAASSHGDPLRLHHVLRKLVSGLAFPV
jgi:hypothetical protein